MPPHLRFNRSMASALSLYEALLARGSQPALTWYSTQGRLELSGAVAANHCAKIAGFLAEEVWASPGATMRLALPLHWKSVLWALGGMCAGLRPSCADGAADVVITNRPRGEYEAGDIVAIDMGPLAFSWTGPELPPGVFDGSAGQLSQPDVLIDTSRHEYSNFTEWANRGTFTASERAYLVCTKLEEAIVAAIHQFEGGSLVIAPNYDEARAQAEGATPARLDIAHA